MFNRDTPVRNITFAALGAVILASVGSAPAVADPPRWSKAHYKVKHGYFPKKLQRYRHRRHRTVHRHVRRSRVVYWDRAPAYTGSISPSLGGTVLGALLGAVTGSQASKGTGRTAAIIGGGFLGAVIGRKIGRRMEEADRAKSQQVLETVPSGQTVTWKNPDTGGRYSLTPTRTYQVISGQHCREYTTRVFIEGNEEQVKGTACRTADGWWQETS